MQGSKQLGAAKTHGTSAPLGCFSGRGGGLSPVVAAALRVGRAGFCVLWVFCWMLLACAPGPAVEVVPPSPGFASPGTLPQPSLGQFAVNSQYSAGIFPQFEVLMPPGPGLDRVQRSCTSCHSLAYIVVQPPLTEDAWRGEVAKMVQVFGANISQSDQDGVVAYLGQNFTPSARATIHRPAETVQGDGVYRATCAMCHQPTGLGLPNAIPPLAGHAADIVQARGGREYLIDLVLYGLVGPLQVAGVPYNSFMPPLLTRLDDAQAAQVLNYVLSSWGNAQRLQAFSSYEPEEIAVRRRTPRTPQQNYSHRPTF